MTTRRVLIFLPIVAAGLLLQSYFWVPTYEQQTRGNPDRPEDYITASIGDASLLNPVLSSDSASSEIENMVFEGLIDRDEDLRFRGRIATGWKITEDAFFHVNENAVVPGLGKATADELVRFLEKKIPKSWDHVSGITALPPRRFEEKWAEKPTKAKPEPAETAFLISAPGRIRFSLTRVDPDLFENLGAILGREYFTSFDAKKYITAPPSITPKQLEAAATDILPAIEHNPILLFHLRPKVTFHDGHYLDANDVKFTYEAIMNPRNLSPRVSDYEPVKSVEVLDPMTVRITYKRLYSPAIASWGMGILPEHLLNEMALEDEARRLGKDPASFSIRNSGFNQRPVGCGPFKFAEWKSDRHILLDRFDQYWEGAPNYKRYVFRIIPDVLTQEMEFYAGTVDGYGVQPHQVARLKADTRFQHFTGTSFGYSYIGYNLRREPFNDPRVRQALGMAIDVNKIIEFVLYGEAESISGPFVKQTDFYNHEVKPIPYDPVGALALLGEAGWKKNAQGILEKNGKPLQFTLITNNGNDIRKAVLAIAQDAWKRIGIDVRTDLLEWSVFIQKRVNQLDFDALVLGWQMGIDPDLYQIWHSSQTQPFQLNFVGFSNPEADDLIIKIREEYDHDRQVAYSRRLHEIIAEAQPYTFLYVGKWTAIMDKRIVIKEIGTGGKPVYKPITPTKTGNYRFYFNRWIKLMEPPTVTADG